MRSEPFLLYLCAEMILAVSYHNSRYHNLGVLNSFTHSIQQMKEAKEASESFLPAFARLPTLWDRTALGRAHQPGVMVVWTAPRTLHPKQRRFLQRLRQPLTGSSRALVLHQSAHSHSRQALHKSATMRRKLVDTTRRRRLASRQWIHVLRATLLDALLSFCWRVLIQPCLVTSIPLSRSRHHQLHIPPRQLCRRKPLSYSWIRARGSVTRLI